MDKKRRKVGKLFAFQRQVETLTAPLARIVDS